MQVLQLSVHHALSELQNTVFLAVFSSPFSTTLAYFCLTNLDSLLAKLQ